MLELNKILQGDCLEKLKELPDESVDCVMTSPPYWALRDYGVEGQLGLEPTFDEYINKLCNIFDEVKRVLKKTGTCWVNLGDTYGGSWGNYGKREGKQRKKNTEVFERKGATPQDFKPPTTNVSQKCLVQIPHRFAIEMCNRGWILRNTNIWHKPNCMPSSAKDRFTVDFEYVFFFVKNKKYYFETQYEELTNPLRTNFQSGNRIHEKNKDRNDNDLGEHSKNFNFKQGRNKRTVWKITTKPFPEAHFAVYPPELCETPIKAGCPEFVCNKCGIPRERIIIIESRKNKEKSSADVKTNNDPTGKINRNNFSGDLRQQEFKGLTDCKCNAGFEGGVVLDPFAGAGTTCLVAKQQNKNYIGIELNPEYIKIAEARIKAVPESLNSFIDNNKKM